MNRRTSSRAATRSRVAPALAALLGAALVTTTVLPAASATTAPAPRAQGGGSDIALKAGAYGTRLTGGQVPAGSGMTAFSVIGCSTVPGVSHHNEVAEANLPSAGTVSGVTTRVWATKSNGGMHSYARSTTAEVVLADSPLGSVSIRAVTSLSHAWHDASGFHSKTTSSVGKIVFTPPVGDPQVLDIPTPGQPVEIPGLARISVGESHDRSNSTGATAWGVALRVKVIPSETELYVSRSKAQALSGVKHGRFGGYSAGTEAEILGGVLVSGRNPVSLMPCQGTNGKTLGKDDADVNLGGGLHAEAVSSKEWAKRYADHSKAWERGSIAGLDLGDGALVIDAVVGKATVVRKAGGGLVRSTAGTRIGSITANGEPQELPLDQTLEIPGVAKLDPKVVSKIPGGLKVIALQITLLDGSGAVIDLGVAKTSIRH